MAGYEETALCHRLPSLTHFLRSTSALYNIPTSTMEIEADQRYVFTSRTSRAHQLKHSISSRSPRVPSVVFGPNDPNTSTGKPKPKPKPKRNAGLLWAKDHLCCFPGEVIEYGPTDPRTTGPKNPPTKPKPKRC